MSDLLVNLSGILLITAIVWWFWMSTAEAKKAGQQVIDILVQDGVYSPARIEVPLNQPFTLRFTRQDASPCAEKVIFAELEKTIELALKQPTEIEMTLPQPGEYVFTCDMQMYRGSLLVKSAS